MENSKIVELFNDTLLNTKALYNKVEGYTENQIYNWKKGRTKPSLGDMLSILFQLKLIEISDNKETVCKQPILKFEKANIKNFSGDNEPEGEYVMTLSGKV